MQTIVDHRGFRLLAMPVLPINKGTIVVGSHNSGQTVRCDDPPLLAALTEAAQEMHLGEHKIGISNVSLPCAGDIEGTFNINRNGNH